MRTILTHGGSFHMDDIFAVAVMELTFPDEKFNVVRTREREQIEKADIVLDVGNTYDPSILRFDHHQAGGAGKRENGIPFATFGLVWKEFGERICSSREVASVIDQKLVQPIDAYDNGVNIINPVFEGVWPYTVSSFFYSYKTIGREDEEELYQTFIQLVLLAKGLLTREIENEKISEQLRNKIEEIYAQSEDGEIVVIDMPVERHIWRPVISKYPEPIYVVYPGISGGKWKVETVPLSNDSLVSRKRFPIEWAGKSGKELADITGVPDAEFSHNNGFLTATISKEGAIEIARKALKS